MPETHERWGGPLIPHTRVGSLGLGLGLFSDMHATPTSSHTPPLHSRGEGWGAGRGGGAPVLSGADVSAAFQTLSSRVLRTGRRVPPVDPFNSCVPPPGWEGFGVWVQAGAAGQSPRAHMQIWMFSCPTALLLRPPSKAVRAHRQHHLGPVPDGQGLFGSPGSPMVGGGGRGLLVGGGSNGFPLRRLEPLATSYNAGLAVPGEAGSFPHRNFSGVFCPLGLGWERLDGCGREGGGRMDHGWKTCANGGRRGMGRARECGPHMTEGGWGGGVPIAGERGRRRRGAAKIGPC